MSNPSADRRGEGHAFNIWHCFNRPIAKPCGSFQHRYHLAFWRWGKR